MKVGHHANVRIVFLTARNLKLIQWLVFSLAVVAIHPELAIEAPFEAAAH